MKIDTPERAASDMKDKEYITRTGKILRKTSLDELPQLINILFGDMSFIGPRPALWDQYLLIKLRTKKGIHELRPGLTGYAQINGRSKISMHQKYRYDLYYKQNLSFILDLNILIKTIFSVLQEEGVDH